MLAPRTNYLLIMACLCLAVWWPHAGIAPVSAAPVLPGVSVDDVGRYEGTSGLTPLVFIGTLSAASSEVVTVDYITVDGSAIAGVDYGLGRGRLTFAPGETQKVLTIWAMGDTLHEPDEGFALVLHDPVNATLARGAAAGLILNDDLHVVGGQGLRLRPDIMELTWQPGTSSLGYHLTRIEVISGKNASLGPLASSASRIVDISAPPSTLLCYVLTPVVEGGTATASSPVCGQSGLSGGTKVPLLLSIGINDGSVANLRWQTPAQGVDLYVVVFLSLIGLPTELGGLPPEAQEFSFDTKGLPMCFLLVGVKGEAVGIADAVCAIGGFSGATKAAQGAAPWSGLDAGPLQRGLQQAKDALPPQVGAALP